MHTNMPIYDIGKIHLIMRMRYHLYIYCRHKGPQYPVIYMNTSKFELHKIYGIKLNVPFIKYKDDSAFFDIARF